MNRPPVVSLHLFRLQERIVALMLCFCLWLPCQAFGINDIDDLTEMSLEDLMDVQITTLSRKSQPLSEAAAAVFVISNNDIRRSGATSVAEVLRMVPGVQVARIDSNKWAITIRGQNGRFANKLLVLVDGRNVYTPLFTGVFWDMQDLMLEDIERIEVIRGPGASIWGANAVNGVINIIRKTAADTSGGLATAGGGTHERGFASLRYGGTLPAQGHYRLYAKYSNRDDFLTVDGGNHKDAWDIFSGGFRVDWALSADDELTLQGDLFFEQAGGLTTQYTITPPYSTLRVDDSDARGGNLMGRWKRRFSDRSDFILQLYYDRITYNALIGDTTVNTYDLDFQHRFQIGERNDWIWGFGYRHIRDHLEGNPAFLTFSPGKRSQDLFSFFIQDEIAVLPERLNLVLGVKLEHNDFTGLEFQPNARAWWSPLANHSFWVSVARAVRTPSRGERDGSVKDLTIPPLTSENPLPLPIASIVGPSPDFGSEELIAYEAGYRFIPRETIAVDLAFYYNDYRDLRSVSPGLPRLDPPLPAWPTSLLAPVVLANTAQRQTWGLELAADWQISERFKLKGAYTYLDTRYELPEEDFPTDLKTSPRHQVSLRTLFNLTESIELDGWLLYVDSLPELDIDHYWRMDLRLAWKPREHIELAIVGQNLLENRHPEFVSEFFAGPTVTIERSVYGKVTFEF